MLATVLDPAWLRPANVADEPSLPPAIGDAFDADRKRPLAPPDVDTLIRVGALGSTPQLIDDGTLWVMHRGEQIAGYAAWTFRAAPYPRSPGVSQTIRRPGIDPALVFGVRPMGGAHQAAGHTLFARMEAEMRDAGYRCAELIVTPASASLYLAVGYLALREVEILLPNATRVRALRLHRWFETQRPAIV